MQRSSMGLMVMGGIALACVLSLVGPSAADTLPLDDLQKPATQEAIPELADVMTKLNKGDVAGALADMKAAVEKHPQLPPAEVMMAQLMSRTNRADTVRYWLEQAIIASPNQPDAYVMLGQDAMQNKRTAESQLLFEKSYQLLEGFTGDAKRKEGLQTIVFGSLAGLAMNRKDWDAAKGYLVESLKLHPDDGRALQLLGRVLFEQGNAEEALEKLKAAKTADPKTLTPEATLANWYEEAGDRANAGKYMVEAIKIAPTDFNTRFVASNWKFQTQDFKQARVQADIALQLAEKQDIDPSAALILAGSIAIFQGDYPAAEAYLRKAIALAPANFAATNNLALALCEQDDEAKRKLAFQYAQINSRLRPDDVEAASTLGRVLFTLKHYADADKVFRKVATTGQSLSPDTAYYIAALYAETDRKEEAKKLLEQVVKKEGLFSQRKNAEQLLKDLGS
ncbi:MAG: tetratricopeptide repeat protein [Pirellulales bacterium]|nr:tetratricopeptide repeat protein [Pirellulales bacterium]